MCRRAAAPIPAPTGPQDTRDLHRRDLLARVHIVQRVSTDLDTSALDQSGHEEAHVDYASFQSDVGRGQLTVNAGGAFSAGTLDVTGVPAVKRGVVGVAVARSSDKTVNFA